jgi:hypothetical protein
MVLQSKWKLAPVLRITAAAALAFGGMLAGTASAIPAGYTCIGTCGTSGADGVVTAPPGGTTYDWVSSSGSSDSSAFDLGLGSETNGSVLRSNVFAADAGDALEFDFNYITSDGAGFADYAWARLLDPSLNPVALIFTARTTPGGDTVPGFGMPPLAATLTPPSTPIVDGAPNWSPLGSSNNLCYSTGCGYTGWIHSSFDIVAGGNYILEFGVVNWSDTGWDSGMALSGATVGGTPITGVPEPATLMLLGLGFAGIVTRSRARRHAA